MANAVKHLLEFGRFRIDPEQRLLLRDQEPIALSPKAFELLVILAQRNGQVVQKDELMNLLWPDTFVEESNLGQHVFQLRKALGESAQSPAYIVTVQGRGYRFAEKVRTVSTGDEEIVLESHSRSRLLIEEETTAAPSSATGRRLRRIGLAVLAAVLVLGVAAAVWMAPAQRPLKVLRVRQITHSGRVEPYGRVLTDGSRIYFTEIMGGTAALAEAPVGGGESSLIATSVPSVAVYDIDPDRSRLLIGTSSTDSNNPLWVVSTSGGSGQRLGDAIASEAGMWTPDGRILFSHGPQIFAIDAGGGEPKKLLTAPGYVIALRLSPRGNVLRFTVRDAASGVTSLWEASADGSKPHPMNLLWPTAALRWGEGVYGGDWTPDGRYFVFRAARDGIHSFWALSENDGWSLKGHSSPVQLYTGPDYIGDPRFSADGKKIFFVDFQERRELVSYDSVHKIFVPYLGGIPARLLSYSHDGKWIAYLNDTDGSLWRSRVDGTEKLQLTFPPLKALHSSWSPDGKSIAFGGRLPGEASKLYLVPFDGGTPEPLTSPDASDTEPSWSPDGRAILFEHWAVSQSGVRQPMVSLLDLKTRQTRIVPESVGFDGVHWSPDGKYAAASDEVHHKVVLYDFARQHWSVLADGAAYGWGIRWSVDSRYVYYQNRVQGEEQPILRVRVSDREVEQITSAHQILRADVLGYAMTGLTPDGSPLASLMRSNSDVYVLELDLP